MGGGGINIIHKITTFLPSDLEYLYESVVEMVPINLLSSIIKVNTTLIVWYSLSFKRQTFVDSSPLRFLQYSIIVVSVVLFWE